MKLAICALYCKPISIIEIWKILLPSLFLMLNLGFTGSVKSSLRTSLGFIVSLLVEVPLALFILILLLIEFPLLMELSLSNDLLGLLLELSSSSSITVSLLFFFEEKFLKILIPEMIKLLKRCVDSIVRQYLLNKSTT